MTTSTAPIKPLDRFIVEGPIARAVWMLGWPTMLPNPRGGLQGRVALESVSSLVGPRRCSTGIRPVDTHAA